MDVASTRPGWGRSCEVISLGRQRSRLTRQPRRQLARIVAVEAKLVHGGKNTQVWDAVVTNEQAGKTMALFRCTQMILYASDLVREVGKRAPPAST